MKTKPSPHHDRVTDALEGRWPDRIPICEQAFASTVASRILGREVVTGSTDAHYFEGCAWLEGEQAHEEFVDRLYRDCAALHRFFDFDILFLPWRHSVRPTKRLSENEILYGDPAGSDWSVGRFDPQSHTFGEIKAGRPPPAFEDVTALLRKQLSQPRSAQGPPSVNPLLLRAVREYGDEFVVAGSSGMAIPMTPGWLEATLLEPALIGDYLDLLMEDTLASLDAQRRAGIRLINGGGDFAFKSGPIYSPRFFHEIMAPRWKRIFDYCRQHDMYYIFRSDGDLWPVADDLFGAARPHAYYEVDCDAGMHFGKLRQRFPELTLIGNVSCDLLFCGGAEQVRAAMRACIEAAAPRMIAATANSVLHGTPPENVIAMYETAKAWRQPA
ncbi:MAG: hypothetical protein HY360_21915 [Verrucomicrobia bacterium]|nr:hypothetical protein [Verrucomicrobiota bacterium]